MGDDGIQLFLSFILPLSCCGCIDSNLVLRKRIEHEERLREMIGTW